MKIHEYQAKGIFQSYGIPTPPGRVAETSAEARSIAEEIGGEVVVKAQIHAGGRGKGGGIRKASGGAEAGEAAEAILGMRLVTHQTGAAGKLVRKVLVEEATAVEREYYVGMVLDRESSRVAVIASPEGGMEIEEVAAKHPEKIFRERVDPLLGLMPFQARHL
ncbi:MAG: ATP-grasp domain-containing protein, partial [Planctomycetota bacterium]